MHILYDLDSIKSRSEKEKAMPPKNKSGLSTDFDLDTCKQESKVICFYIKKDLCTMKHTIS